MEKRPDHAVAGPSRGYPANNSTAHFYVFSGAIQFGAYMLIPFWFALNEFVHIILFGSYHQYERSLVSKIA